jgi:hypothetical protein
MQKFHYCCVYSCTYLHSHRGTGLSNSVETISILAAELVQSTTLQPAYRNPTLEKQMLKDEDKEYLGVDWMDLSDDDMQLVAYHAIINNTVIHFA